MRRAVQFLAVLLAGLGLLTWVGYAVITGFTRDWTEKDLRLRTQLAVTSARQSLVSHWEGDRDVLNAILADITRDERIMGAAACSMDGHPVASTVGFPPAFTCRSTVDRLRQQTLATGGTWSMSTDLPSGRVQLSATTLEAEGSPLGIILLVHDLSFVERREGTTRNLLLGMYFFLALAASLITLLAARLAWKGWTLELQRALSGGGSGTKEFQPLVRDVRSLVDRLGREREGEVRSGPWTPDRLRSALKQHLQGERVVVLANREPYIHE